MATGVSGTMGGGSPQQITEPRPAYVWSGSAWVPIGGGSNKGGGVPLGTVVAWAGQENAVPAGWLLCNGQPVPLSSALSSMLSHTPDLRERFVLGSNTAAETPPGAVGGSATITVENMPSHQHGYQSGNRTNDGYGLSATAFHQGNVNVGTTDKATSGTGGGTDYWPRYWAAAYIIRSELTAADVADLAALDARYPRARIATGRATTTATGQVAVTFPAGRFTATPRVTVTPVGIGAAFGSVSATTAAGFTITARQTGANDGPANTNGLPNCSFDWIAVQET